MLLPDMAVQHRVTVEKNKLFLINKLTLKGFGIHAGALFFS